MELMQDKCLNDM